MVDGLVSDFGSSKYHPHSLCVCVCLALVQASPGIRYTERKTCCNRFQKIYWCSHWQLAALSSSLHPSFFASLNGYLSEWDIRYTTDHSQWQRAGVVPWFLSSPVAKAA